MNHITQDISEGNPQSDDWDIEWAECRAELDLLSDRSKFSKCYCDSANHGNPVAEKAYRAGVKQSAIDSLKILMNPSLQAFEISGELYSLERQAKQERTKSRVSANVGVHYGIYVNGHEVEAARTRGIAHGLVDAIRIAEESETVSDNELTDEEFDQQQAAQVNRIRQHLPRYSAWVESICRWADSDCVDVDFHEFCLESKNKMGGMPSELANVPGLVGEFVRYCNDNAHRQQPELALATGLTLLATLAGRKVRDDYNSRCNLFCIGLAGTSSGKEFPRQVAKDILLRCGQSNSIAEAFASHAGLIGAVKDSPDLLALVDEFGRYLSTQNSKSADSHLSLIPTIMMRMFSSSNSVFVADRYSDTKRNPLITIQYPNLNVMGTTVSGNFFKALQAENLNDGLLNRYLVFEASVDLPDIRRVKVTPIPQSLVDTAKKWAARGIGAGDPTDIFPDPLVISEDATATELFEQFAAMCDDVARSERNPICRGLWPRTYEKARKLAMLYACSESFETPKITAAAATWAIAFATYCTEFVEQAASIHVADNDHQRSAKLVLRIITEAGKAGISRESLYRRIDHTMKSRDLRDILMELVESVEIKCTEVQTKGRPSHVFHAAR